MQASWSLHYLQEDLQASLTASGRWNVPSEDQNLDVEDDLDLADDALAAGDALVAATTSVAKQLKIKNLDGIADATRQQRERAHPTMVLPDSVQNVLDTVTQKGVKALPVHQEDFRTARKKKGGLHRLRKSVVVVGH